MMQLTSTLTLRNLILGEDDLLPIELRDTQFPVPDPEWTWIVEREGKPIALILTSYASGVLMFWRILSTASARLSPNWLLAALPRILENTRLRGCVGYASFFRDSRPEEAHFARLLQRAGGKVEPFTGSFGAAPLEAECPISESARLLRLLAS
jgi:hypothetical protein